MGVDGHTISPGYDYDSAKDDMRKRLNLQPENFFLPREATKRKFSSIMDWAAKYSFFGTPIYFEFLGGHRDLTCSAWAIPTRNIRGTGKAHALTTDGHYGSYKELLEKNPVGKLRRRRRRRQRQALRQNCMVHCGYEPTAALGRCAKPGDTWKNVAFNFGPKPKPRIEGANVQAFTGVTTGNGHKTGKPKKQEQAAA